MKNIATTVALATFANAIKISTENPDELRFNEWAALHSKSYADAVERGQRFENWLKNDAEVKRLNSNPNNTFTAKQNHLSDLSRQEYLAMLGDDEQDGKNKLAQTETKASATVFS